MNTEELIKNVEAWSEAKGLYNADPRAQFLKVIEEVGETAGALARGKIVALEDGIGDIAITIIILAQQNGLTFKGCLESAWLEIKDRTGETVDGVFIKDSE